MLSRDHRKLLENNLDGLDRLFDREVAAVDTRALIFATSKAFTGDELSPVFEVAIRELDKIVRSDSTREEKQDLALVVTDELRKLIAQRLELDAMENPKQRHVR
jgi:hypothetical protein